LFPHPIVIFLAVMFSVFAQRFDKVIHMVSDNLIRKYEFLVVVIYYGAARLIVEEKRPSADKRLEIANIFGIPWEVLSDFRQKLTFAPRPFEAGLD
jgi:hypothetical protein